MAQRVSKKPKPDPVLAREQLTVLQGWYEAYGPKFFLGLVFWVQSKSAIKHPDGAVSNLLPFVPNRMQSILIDTIAQFNRVLKMRQGGATTFFMIFRVLLPIILNPGRNGLVISQNGFYASKIFRIAKRALKHFGLRNPLRIDDPENELGIAFQNNLLHTEYSNRKELVFSMLDSQMIVESAEIEEAGQSVTLQHVLASEVARWPRKPEETISNIRGALVPTGTMDEESTANAAAGYFYERFKYSMENPKDADAKPHFFEHYYSDEYRLYVPKSERDEFIASITSDEAALIRRIYDEVKELAWLGTPGNRIFVPQPAITAKTIDDLIKQVHVSVLEELYAKINWRRGQIKGQRKNFFEKYPESWETAFLVSGNLFFDRDIIAARGLELKHYKPFQQFSRVLMHKQRIQGRRYLIGADAATGRTVVNEDSDFSEAVVIDLDTGEEVAEYFDRLPSDDFAADLAELGKAYNNAIIAVERAGGYGDAVIIALQSIENYANLYQHKTWDKHTKTEVLIEGFPTTTATRVIALNAVSRFVSKNPDMVWSKRFISQAYAFVRNAKGKPEAMEGSHDDAVMCRSVVYGARAALLGFWDPTSRHREKYKYADEMTQDEIDDAA